MTNRPSSLRAALCALALFAPLTAQAAEPCEHSLVLVSDADTVLVPQGTPSVPTWDAHVAWAYSSAQLADSTWVWRSVMVDNPLAAQTQRFLREFTLPAGATDIEAALVLAADNTFKFWVNGTLAGDSPAEDNFSDVQVFDLAALLVGGANTLEFEIVNLPGMPDATLNPAGLLYELQVDYVLGESGASCQIDPCGYGAEVASVIHPCVETGVTACTPTGTTCEGSGCRAATVWQLGRFDFAVDPIAGASEYPATDAHSDVFDYTVVGQGTQTPAMPGYLSTVAMSTIDPTRALTDGATELRIHFTLDAPATGLHLDWSRYGSEDNAIYLDGAATPLMTTAMAEGANLVLQVPLPDLAAGAHTVTIRQLGGGADNGNYLDAIRLVQTVCGAPGAELCGNGIDDNCDCTADEGFDGLGDACSAGVGACAATGTVTCSADGLSSGCDAVAGAPAADDASCNGIDDDCNGAVDDGFVAVGTDCGVGVCAARGVTSCVAGVVSDSCTVGAATGDDTDCDGDDDDCDGVADDGYVSTDTTCGIGACAATGTLSCQGGVASDSCAAGAPAAADLCDGVDEDCDGQTDEDFVAAVTDCGSGACAAQGLTSCVAGVVSDSCEPNIQPETCFDDIDNNCDGEVDEGCGCEGGFVLVSDENTVLLPQQAPAVQTWSGHPAWEASSARLADSAWIWNSFLVNDPLNDETQTFFRQVLIPSRARSIEALLHLSTDNSYKVWVNGTLVADAPVEFNYVGIQTIDISAQLVPGENSVTFEVMNMGGAPSPNLNPAGLIYELSVDYVLAARQRTYQATQAVGSGHDHAIWLPGLDGDGVTRLRLEDDARFEVFADNRAHFFGTAVVYDGPQGATGARWAVDVWFDGRGIGAAGQGSGGPKIELGEDVQPPSVTDAWEYFDMDGGFAEMTNLSDEADVVRFVMYPAGSVFPFQMGLTANGKNSELGGSGWLTWMRARPGHVSSGTGDFNLSFELLVGEDTCGPAIACCVGAACDESTCDGVDNDCDTLVDENYVPSASSCGLGQCGAVGELTCQNGLEVNTCAPGVGTEETCNDLDDDCDGETDEGLGKGASCAVDPCGYGSGVVATLQPCTEAGVTVCAPDGGTTCETSGCRLETVFQLGTFEFGAGSSDEFPADDHHTESFDYYVSGAGAASPELPGYLSNVALSSIDPTRRLVNSTATLRIHFTLGTSAEGAELHLSRSGSEENTVYLDGVTLVTTQGAEGANATTIVALGDVAAGDHVLTLVYGGGGSDNGNYLDALRVVARACGLVGGELCGNGLDDNCDCTVDEGFETVGEPCAEGQGACRAEGERVCTPDGLATMCSAIPGVAAPADVVCDGIDEDCDGLVDEEYEPELTSCGIGVCEAVGFTECSGGRVDDTCAPGSPTGPDTDCNGQDDDCNGAVDDHYAVSDTLCGVGECSATGELVCLRGSEMDTCSPGAPTEDTNCDGLDNDCDADTDEDFQVVDTSCGLGECESHGQLLCSGGTLVDTCRVDEGSPELCDGLDNDCDGDADEDLDGEFYSVSQGRQFFSIQPLEGSADVATFYDYGSQYRASANTGLEISNRTLVALYRDADGILSLVVIHDRPRDGSGGKFRMDLSGLTQGQHAVKDDPLQRRDKFSPLNGPYQWAWNPCCTDGLAIEDVGDDVCVTIDPTLVSGIQGIDILTGADDGSRVSLDSLDAAFTICSEVCEASPTRGGNGTAPTP
ncbi:MAG: MopE-related protein [Myxococcota bacterium]